MDKQGGIHVPVGKISFEEKALTENMRMLIEALSHASPQLSNFQAVKSLAVSTTMGPGVRVDINQFKKKL